MQVQNDTDLDMASMGEVLASFNEKTGDNLIPILQRIQEAYGYLPADILNEVSKRTGIPVSRMFGVATFYEQFHLEPRGRNTIKCCRGTACHVRGVQSVVEELSRELGVGEGETTPDMKFTFETVACLGTCFLAPVMMINNDYHGHLTVEKIKEILERY
ncbi:NADH-quinone oxidoreductase subunit NuoE [Candidatus Hydrogenedentota bacterium]